MESKDHMVYIRQKSAEIRQLGVEFQKLTEEYPDLLSQDDEFSELLAMNGFDVFMVLQNVDIICISVMRQRQELLVKLFEAKQRQQNDDDAEELAILKDDIFRYGGFLESTSRTVHRWMSEFIHNVGDLPLRQLKGEFGEAYTPPKYGKEMSVEILALDMLKIN